MPIASRRRPGDGSANGCLHGTGLYASGRGVQPGTGLSRTGPFVVAVSGTSGAGKTTVVEGLVDSYTATGREAVAFHFDDYAHVSRMPGSLIDWMDCGADPDEWRTDQLVADLDDRITDPTSRDTVIVVEEPFGRARTSIGQLIDLSVHLGLPLGVSLARRLLREFVPGSGGVDDRSADRLRDYLTLYVHGGGAAYERIDALARESCDLILDGLRSPSELVEDVRHEVARRWGPPTPG